MDIFTSENFELGLLPLLTLLVIAVSYRMNLAGNDTKKDSALHEAYWWGGGFFASGVIDYLILGVYSF